MDGILTFEFYFIVITSLTSQLLENQPFYMQHLRFSRRGATPCGLVDIYETTRLHTPQDTKLKLIYMYILISNSINSVYCVFICT
jgi:hypothetical protein